MVPNLRPHPYARPIPVDPNPPAPRPDGGSSPGLVETAVIVGRRRRLRELAAAAMAQARRVGEPRASRESSGC